MFRFLFFALLFISLALANTAEGGKTAAWITLDGDVDPGMSDYANRAIAEAVAKNGYDCFRSKHLRRPSGCGF